MKHFTPERWSDFARGVVTGPECATMEGHLSSGCATCGRIADVLAKLAAAAKAEAAYEAPPELTNRAAALFARPRPRGLSRVLRVVPELVFATFRDPLPAGVRAREWPSQVLYHVLDFSIDLHVKSERLDDERGSSRMVLVGQIADRKDPRKRLADIVISLVYGRQVAAHDVSNQWGEFYLVYEPVKRLRLQILDGARNIEIPLPRFSGR